MGFVWGFVGLSREAGGYAMNILIKVIAIVVSVLATLVFLGWLGLHIKPASFPALLQQQPKLEMVPLPKGLPAPVERYYRQMYGDTVPIIQSAVMSGRGAIRPLDWGRPCPCGSASSTRPGEIIVTISKRRSSAYR